MSDNTEVRTTRIIYPQIYAYTTPGVDYNVGWIKIGYTEKQNVEKRIKDQTHTANIKADILWSEPAQFYKSGKWFIDKQLHAYLRAYKNRKQNPKTEWFYYNGNQENALLDLKDFRNGDISQAGDVEQLDYVLRAEQIDAVNSTLNYAKEHKGGEYLWNAKPRFGKTLTTYDLARKLGAKNVLIVTNRPAIANSWFDDFQKFIEWQTDYDFVSTTDSLKERPAHSREEHISQLDDGKEGQIVFISLQDLKGAISFGGSIDKLKWVKDINWDLLVIDESHEGVDTFKTDIAFDNINRDFTLHLSGTPFKAVASGKFSADQIYNWTYADEQEAKVKWSDDLEEVNPYEKLPRLNLFSYQMSQMITDEVNKGTEIDENKNIDYAFDLNEFFETKENGDFTHEVEVKKWLDTLTSNKKYPFSTNELRNELKHTLWLLNRVASAKALEKLLKVHPVFENYEIILAAGDGKTDDNQVINQKSLDRVKSAIADNDKTITLSVGQLTTGVTVPEWTAVLMLSNIKTPSLFMQAAFRAQNPWSYESEGQMHQKENAYIFDFAPERTLVIYDEFANDLSSETTNGGGTTNKREDKIRTLLNFFPVIAEDTEGEMIELDVSQILTIPKTIKAQETVRRGFMSNFLFKNVSGIFASSEARDILEQLKPADDRKKLPNNLNEPINTQGVNLDEKGEVLVERDIVIAQTEAHFGNKVFGDIEPLISEELDGSSANLSKVISDAFKQDTQDQIKDLAKDAGLSAKDASQILQQNSNVIAREVEIVEKQRDIKHAEAKIEFERIVSDAHQDQEKIADAKLAYENKQKQIEETSKKELVEAYESKAKELTRDSTETILKKAEDKKKSVVEDDVRSRLRGFTRTIPSFLMAYGDETTTLSTFEKKIDPNVFKDVTGITIEQFKMLRDEHEFFDGVVFDESIQEFLKKRVELADYFDDSQQEDIFDYIPSQQTNQIFTPKKIVKLMIDKLEEGDPEIFNSDETTFVDFYVKSGLYITEIVKRLFKSKKLIKKYPDENERLKHILENQVYGYMPSDIIYKIATNFIFGTRNDISRKNFIAQDVTEIAKKGEVLDMKFDVVVGNPPYQETVSNSGNNQHDMPVYNYFYDLAEKIGNKYTLISPARFLTGSGYTPKKWNEKMLQDEHLKISYYNPKSSEVFSNTDIKGGVVVLQRDKDKILGPINFFTPDPILSSAALKVIKRLDGKSLKDIMFVQTKMNLDLVYSEFAKFRTIRPEGSISDMRLGTDSLVLFADMLSETKDKENSVELFGLLPGNKRASRYINPKYLLTNDATSTKIDKYKVLVPKANGSGTIGETISTPVIGTPVIGTPGMGHTMSFRSIGAFDTEIEAENLLKYIKTKFTRAMIGTLKSTQDMPPKVFANVPLQDFTPNSDIDWTKSISEIDQQLYKKYELTKEEIKFIEDKVKSMD